MNRWLEFIDEAWDLMRLKKTKFKLNGCTFCLYKQDEAICQERFSQIICIRAKSEWRTRRIQRNE